MAFLRLGAFGTAVTGTLGNAVFAETSNGTVVRGRPTVNNPNTPAQAQQRYCFTRAQSEYRLLSRAENAAWKQYALSPLNADPNTGAPGGRTAYAAWVRLAARWVAFHPNDTPPRQPPRFPYAGDPLSFAVITAPGQIIIQASAANSPDTRTVIALLPLKFESQFYRLRDLTTAATVQFTPDDLQLTLEVEPGWYALATHFVSTQTGQYTASTQYEPILVD
jgi:hypothetical protein